MRNFTTKMMTLGLLVVAMASTGCDKTAMALINPEKVAAELVQPEGQRQAQWYSIWMGGW
jgi:hypothetical protein